MGKRGRIIGIWALAAVLAATTLAIVARPMLIAWRCYELHASEELADSELVHKLESPTLVLQIAAGPHSGQACTAPLGAWLDIYQKS